MHGALLKHNVSNNKETGRVAYMHNMLDSVDI